MKEKIDDRILKVLGDGESHDEWEIASTIYDWNDTKANRAKHGAWIRVIVQALHRLKQKGLVGYFWVSHGEGVPGSRLWLIHEWSKIARKSHIER
jgi:hypothetical protein